MSEIQQLFDRFGVTGAEPAWSSATLESAVDRALAVASPEDLIRGVHGLLRRPDLSSAHRNFVLDFVRALVRKLGPDFGGCDLGWLPGAIGSPAQALLAVHLLPESRFDADLVLAVLSQLERTEDFDHAVIQIQDTLVRPEIARGLFAARPDLAKRVRAALAH